MPSKSALGGRAAASGFTRSIAADQCYVIAEAGLNHNGSLEIAKKLIDVAAEAGADAVKFQKRTVDRLAIPSVLDAADNRFPDFGRTYREIRERLEFSLDQYRELKRHAEALRIDFFVTAFDTEAVDFLEELGVTSYKLASHSLTNLELLEYVAMLRKPTVLSTGMAELSEIDTAVEIFRRHDAPLSLMHCVSAYPTPLDQCNLSMIPVLAERYGLPVGYSGHELGYLPSLVAVAMGARFIERHHTIDKAMVGFDHKISLTPDELAAMIRDIREIPKIRGEGEKTVTETEWTTRRKYHVSMASSVAIPAGAEVTPAMITWRNPGTGIPPKGAAGIFGRRAKNEIPAGVLLAEEMFE